MNVRRTATALCAVGAIATAATGTAVAASAGANSHTLKFVAHQKGNGIELSKSSGAVSEVDTASGKTIGYDVLYETFAGKTGVVSGTVVTKGGIIYFRIPATNSKTLSGKLTGGIGKFKNATGTITATNLNKAGTKTAVTITYK